MKGPHFEGDVVADFSDLRKLHILTDKLRRLVHVLKLNVRIACQLEKGLSRISAASSPTLRTSFAEVQVKLDQFLLGQETSVSRIESLIARSSGIGQLVSLLSTLEHLNLTDLRAGAEHTGYSGGGSKQANQSRDAEIVRTGHKREQVDEKTDRAIYPVYWVYDGDCINIRGLPTGHLFSGKYPTIPYH